MSLSFSPTIFTPASFFKSSQRKQAYNALHFVCRSFVSQKSIPLLFSLFVLRRNGKHNLKMRLAHTSRACPLCFFLPLARNIIDKLQLI